MINEEVIASIPVADLEDGSVPTWSDDDNRYIAGTGGGTAAFGLGMFVAWGGDPAAPIPGNSLEANGQVVSAGTYSGLAAIYPSWVDGDDLTIPDLTGHTIAGYKSGDPYFGTLGDFVGEAEHTLTEGEMPSHDHSASTGTDGNHTHRSRGYWTGGGGTGRSIANSYIGGDPTDNNALLSAGNHSHTVSINDTGNDEAHTNVQPSYVGRWLVIAADGAGEYSPTVQAALTGRVDTLEAVLTTQSGYVDRVGDGSDTMDMPEVTFPLPFAAGTFPTVVISVHGYKSGTDTADPDGFQPGAANLMQAPQLDGISPTSFTARMSRSSGGFVTSGRYMIAWIAHGTLA